MAILMTQARPYARAIYDVAHTEQRVAAWRTALHSFAKVINEKQVLRYLNAPTVTAKDVLAVFAVVEASLSDSQKALLNLLATRHQLVLLPAIADCFEQLVLAEQDMLSVDIKSAHELKADEKATLEATLTKKLNKKLDVHYDISSELLGGFIISTQAWVIDNSLKGQLAQLKKTVMG